MGHLLEDGDGSHPEGIPFTVDSVRYLGCYHKFFLLLTAITQKILIYYIYELLSASGRQSHHFRAEFGKACLGLPRPSSVCLGPPRPTPHLASGVGSLGDRPQTGARYLLAAG